MLKQSANIQSQEIILNSSKGVWINNNNSDFFKISIKNECLQPFTNLILNIQVQGNCYYITFLIHSDVGREEYFPIYQSLILNQKPTQYDQEIIGNLEFKGISLERFDTISLSGSFQFLIKRPKDYIYQNMETALSSKQIVERLRIECDDENLNEIDKLKELKYLTFNNNCYNTLLPNEIFGLTKIEKLVLTNSFLKEVSSDIGNLDSLKELNLKRNYLKGLPYELSQCQKLEKITLRENKNCDLSNLQHCKNLKYIDIAKCNVKKLPMGIQKLSNLEQLIMSNNPNLDFSTVPSMNNLKELKLDYCNLQEISTNIVYFQNLKTLSLSGNSHLNWEKTLNLLKKLPNLRKLILEDCNMKRIPKKLFEFRHLDLLELWRNNISDVEIELLEKALPNTNISY